jgi:CheY-like chemotaxis protein
VTKIHVIVADDDANIRTVTRAHLERLGCRVTVASDGREALERHLVDPADVLLTDMVMRGTGGVDTIREFRKSYPGLRIVAMSGDTLGRDFLRIAANIGATAVLAKPFTAQQLADAIGIAPPASSG